MKPRRLSAAELGRGGQIWSRDGKSALCKSISSTFWHPSWDSTSVQSMGLLHLAVAAFRGLLSTGVGVTGVGGSQRNEGGR